jgi:hypothetical protein
MKRPPGPPHRALVDHLGLDVRRLSQREADRLGVALVRGLIVWISHRPQEEKMRILRDVWPGVTDGELCAAARDLERRLLAEIAGSRRTS